jgi:hypothetical protein
MRRWEEIMTIESIRLIDEALTALRRSFHRDEVQIEIDLLEEVQASLIRHFNRYTTYDRRHDSLQSDRVISILHRELA